MPHISDVKNMNMKNIKIVNVIGSRANPSRKLESPIPKKTTNIIGLRPTLSAKNCIMIAKKYPIEAIAIMKYHIVGPIPKSAYIYEFIAK
jgi:hypothetical protein